MTPTFKRRFLVAFLALLLTFVTIELGLRTAGAILAKRATAEAVQRHGEGPTILAIGESTTAGLGVSRKESYPRQLEQSLRKHYSNPSIQVVYPWAIGRNSSQQLNRISRYLEAFEPDLVLLMCGVNNPWSLEESNITQFIEDDDSVSRRIRFRQLIDKSRLAKLIRLALIDLRYVMDDLRGKPEEGKWPPPSWILDWRDEHREEFLQLWRSDIGAMIERSLRSGAQVALMTYPRYEFPPPEEFRDLAAKYDVPLINIHRAFRTRLKRSELSDYFLEDGYHPNPQGYKLLADEILLRIVELDSLGLNAEDP